MVERGVGSVRRRFSKIKLGKKGSKSSVKDGCPADTRKSEVASVAEE
jgi:hypothetical protein